jgi:hypothetical protein
MVKSHNKVHQNEIWKVLVFFLFFHVLGLFIPKNQVIESEKKIPSVTRRCRLSHLKGYRFEISATLRQLGWIDAPHAQNFEISRENSGIKNKLKSVLKIL